MAWFGKKKAQTPPEEENFISHLTELRDRVIRSLLVILILFGACFYVAPELMKFLAQPLQHALPLLPQSRHVGSRDGRSAYGGRIADAGHALP